jgi:hypothetical protein
LKSIALPLSLNGTCSSRRLVFDANAASASGVYAGAIATSTNCLFVVMHRDDTSSNHQVTRNFMKFDFAAGVWTTIATSAASSGNASVNSEWPDYTGNAQNTLCLPLRSFSNPADIRPCMIELPIGVVSEQHYLWAYNAAGSPAWTRYQFEPDNVANYAVYDMKDRSLVLTNRTSGNPVSYFTGATHLRLYWDKPFGFDQAAAAGAANADPLGIYVGGLNPQGTGAGRSAITLDPDRICDLGRGGTAQQSRYQPSLGLQYQGGQVAGTGYNGMGSNTFDADTGFSMGIFPGLTSTAYTAAGFGAQETGTPHFTPLGGGPPFNTFFFNPSYASGKNVRTRRAIFYGNMKYRNITPPSNGTIGSWGQYHDRVFYIIEDQKRRVVRSGIVRLPQLTGANNTAGRTGPQLVRGMIYDEINNQLLVLCSRYVSGYITNFLFYPL